MSTGLVIRHHPEDDAGLLGEAFARRGVQLVTVLLNAQTPTPSLEGYDFVVILGSTNAVYDQEVQESWLHRELALIDDADKSGVPILGVCFGAQALCHAFGGTVAPSPSPEVGWFDVEAAPDAPYFAGPWFEYHFDRCALPPSATVLATSPRAVQAFTIGRHWGVQFHPELDDRLLSAWFAEGDDDVRALGLSPDELLQQTRDQTPEARQRADRLVGAFLASLTH